jgi:Tfp pilus assembly protein PilF
MISRLINLLFVWLFLIPSGNATVSQSPPELVRLHNDFAMRYLEPEPHMALAKYYLEQGDRRQAFFTLEAARRGVLENKVFDHAFQVAFEDFENGKSAEERLLSEQAQNPQSADIQFQLADIYISRTDYPKAKQILAKALAEHPEDFRFTFGLAEILRIEGKNKDAERMIEDFVKRYPESPEAYESRADSLHKTDPQKARQLLEEGVSKYPNDGGLLFGLAAILQEAGDLEKAEVGFGKAASLSPKSVNIQSWVGRFFFKVRNNGEKALPYYLNAYFRSPDAYETEFVESRIRAIYSAQAQASFQNQLRAKKPLIEMLGEPDPLVVSLALEQIDKAWNPTYVSVLVDLMGNEDDGVRWGATQLLKKRVDTSFDPTLRMLLKDKDLRKRGLAAYIAVYRWKNASFPFIDELLAEEAELLRFDALSALILEGGEAGKQRALAHAGRETHPTLKKLLESAR